MNSPQRRPTTFRLTPELDKIITEEAKRLGVSKNAFVQMTLSKALEDREEKRLQPTGTDS